MTIQIQGDQLVQIETRCRRCGGNRLWKDAIVREDHCVDCEPPHVIIRHLIDQQIIKRLAQRAQMKQWEDEDEDDAERQLYTLRTGKTS